ncbi:MAG TPA: phage holin family protein [Solirubrobacteraceae bacterium]|nr:phage holin family protein [Solirubrobacteraceae bacterium]
MAAETPPKPAPDSLGAAVSEVSERMSVLLREEIELAKAEVVTKVSSIARGAAAVAAGAVFGVFALVFVLLSIAWGVNAATGSLWIGFVGVMVVLLILTLFAFWFAWRKLKVGAPTPKMAIDEAKKIRSTVSSSSSQQITTGGKGTS